MLRFIQNFFICSLFVLFCSPSFGQFKKYGGKKKPQKMGAFLQPLNDVGWYFGVGATFTPRLNFIDFDPTLTTSTFQPEILTAINLQQQSQVGLYLEVGRYKLMSTSKLLSYIDYGLAYKMLRAGQSYDLVRTGLSSSDTSNHTQIYRSHAAVAHFNANNVLAINKNIFFQNTLGVNVDYAFSQRLETSDATGFDETYEIIPVSYWRNCNINLELEFA